MVAVLERSKRDRLLRQDVFPEVTRPQPTDVQVVLEERVDGVDRAVFLLHALNLPAPCELPGHLARLPTVASGNRQMVFGRGDQDLLGMLEVEIDRREQRLQRGLIPDPDGVLRSRVRLAFDDRRLRAADPLEIVGQLVRRAPSERRSVFHDDNRRRADAVFDEHKFRLSSGKTACRTANRDRHKQAPGSPQPMSITFHRASGSSCS